MHHSWHHSASAFPSLSDTTVDALGDLIDEDMALHRRQRSISAVLIGAPAVAKSAEPPPHSRPSVATRLADVVALQHRAATSNNMLQRSAAQHGARRRGRHARAADQAGAVARADARVEHPVSARVPRGRARPVTGRPGPEAAAHRRVRARRKRRRQNEMWMRCVRFATRLGAHSAARGSPRLALRSAGARSLCPSPPATVCASCGLVPCGAQPVDPT